jgi:Uma2 family endonuclease
MIGELATMSVTEYLEFEKTSEVRHEYVDGVLIPTLGISRQHGKIVLNIVEVLRPKARAKQCELQAIDIKTPTQNSRYRYPDILISCKPNNDKYILENPCLVIEVASNSTEHTDRGSKVTEYLKILSLETYVIAQQDKPEITIYRRDEKGWRVDILEVTGEFHIPCLETNLTLEEIYMDVVF